MNLSIFTSTTRSRLLVRVACLFTACTPCSCPSLKYLRLLFRAMARVPGTHHMFFKFQSAISRQMDIVIEAFPTTPWLFFYRNAVEVRVASRPRITTRFSQKPFLFGLRHCSRCHVQTAAAPAVSVSSSLVIVSDSTACSSHTPCRLPGSVNETLQVLVSNLRSPEGPCVRTLRDPPAEVTKLLGSAYSGTSTSKEAYCAAYITYLRSNALALSETVSNGGFMNYANLPQAFIGACVRLHACAAPLGFASPPLVDLTVVIP
jgi:hypothetical protein